MYPSLKEFKRLAKEYDRLTVYREMNGDMETPVSMLSKLLPFERVILLESAKQNKTYSRFSFLAFEITEKLVLREEGFYRSGDFGGPLSRLEEVLSPERMPDYSQYGGFSGGYVGHLNYEFAGSCDLLKAPLARRNPELGSLYKVEKFLVYDNYTNAIYLAISRRTGETDPEQQYQEIASELTSTEHRIKTLTGAARPAVGKPVVTRWIPRGLFIDRVGRTREMIEEGEAIQVVLSDFVEANNVDPFEFYRNLRRINASPYMFFLKDGADSVVGSSPEIHLRIRERVATLKPIAGTRRLQGPDEAHEAAHSLLNDEKERAEHLMLVDLARNDLSRICDVKSVAVKSFMEPETYSHVVHLVSEVKGLLRDEVTILDALAQTFPAGTVTGAPKVRAMEIIDGMEEHPRGPYAGCMGYIGFNGSVDMAITIRTALFDGSKARMQAGAGIVYDSVPEKEYDEVMGKLLVLLKSGGLA